MGGGDLNMKKSWHPQRMDNQEKVWKKEEAAKKEKQRMMELKRELHAEKDREEIRKRGEESGVLKKSKDRVDWMYNQPKVNEEDYLLGKQVDTAILEHQETKTKEAASGGPSLAIDMAAKVKEDPLFAIKKQEMSHRKALMNNPIRMKQLQQMLKAQVAAKEKSKKAKKMKSEKSKKGKKHKHHKSKRSSSDDSDSYSSEEDKRDRRMKKKMAKRRDSSDTDASDEYRKDRRKKEKRSKHRRDSSDDSEDERRMKRIKGNKKSYSRRDSSEERPSRNIPPGYGLIGGNKARRRHESSSDDETSGPLHRQPGRDRHRDKHVDRHGDRHSHRHSREEERYRERRRSRSRSRSPVRRPRSPDRKESRSKPKKLDADELERRRAEMMENAKWRDEQRKGRVKKYEAEETAEAELEKKKSKDARFLDPMRLPSNSSVEDRIKRNVFSIQRTNAALDKNFARR